MSSTDLLPKMLRDSSGLEALLITKTNLLDGPTPTQEQSDSVTVLTGLTLEGNFKKIFDFQFQSLKFSAGLPQPDNRAAGENPPSQETCLAILNNFYADGIKWHDVACHHKKPTVCEQRS